MKICKWIVLVFLLVLAQLQASSQTQFSGWLASFNTFKVNNRFSIHFDGQLRSADKLREMQTILLRPGVNWHVNKSWMLSAGYAFISNRRSIRSVSSLLPEHRIWQQAIAAHKIKNISASHRFRFEERFISNGIVANNELEADGHSKAFRFRYFIRNIIHVSQKNSFTKGVFTALQNEIFLNTGDKSAVNGKTFDQNRFYVAIGYRLPGKFDIETGYMNQYTVTRTGFINNHVAQLAVYKRL